MCVVKGKPGIDGCGASSNLVIPTEAYANKPPETKLAGGFLRPCDNN